MLQVEVVSEGDHVHELHVVLAGLTESFKPGVAENAEDISVTVSPDNDGSMHSTMSRSVAWFVSGLFSASLQSDQSLSVLNTHK